MRILGPHGTTPASGPTGPRRVGQSTFALPDMAGPATTRAPAAPLAPTSLDALLALQSVDDPTERRRRSVKQGRTALDALDALKIAMLSGEPSPASVAQLQSVAAGLKASSGDPGLDAVMAEIDLRVEVEIAKAQRR